MNRANHFSSRLAFWRLRIASAAADIRTGVDHMSERRRQRRALARLDHRLLHDIGLSTEAIQDEVQRPFWR